MSKALVSAQIAAFASAVAVFVAPDMATAEDLERCYGIAMAGENDCATIFEHSCAGQSATDYDGNDWQIVPMGTCAAPGSTTAFDGVGGPIDAVEPAALEHSDNG